VQDRLDIPGESADLRARRTRDQLAWALVALLHEKAYDDISVQDIAERAQVGRSTFYAHFQDKDEMFVRHNVVFGQLMGERLVWDESLQAFRFPIRFMFEHVRQMRPLYDALAKSRRLDLLLKVWQVNMTEVFERRITESRRDADAAAMTAPMPAAILAHHVAGTIMTLLVWWLDHHYPLDSQRMEDHFHHLTNGLR
jgi:AcrR family transcriptional regulator